MVIIYFNKEIIITVMRITTDNNRDYKKLGK